MFDQGRGFGRADGSTNHLWLVNYKIATNLTYKVLTFSHQPLCHSLVLRGGSAVKRWTCDLHTHTHTHSFISPSWQPNTENTENKQ